MTRTRSIRISHRSAGRPRGDRHQRIVARVSAAEHERITAACADRRYTLADLVMLGVKRVERVERMPDAQIEALMVEAGAAGDAAQVALCERALAGDVEARQACEAAVEDARAQREDARP